MDTLGYILLFTFLGSIVSLIGGILLLIKEKITLKISHILASFAAGALLATAFFDLMPEAAHEAEGTEINIFLWTLIGILLFFSLERFIHWFHHHHEHQGEIRKAIVPLIVVGDGVHNFIDGVAIAASFLVSVPLGIATTFAVAAHEVPQEIADFGILLHAGLKRSKIIFWNLVSALTAILGALVTYLSADFLEGLLPIFLSLTAGFFIYIAASDLIPEIHNQEKKKVAFLESLALFVGVIVVYLFISFLGEAH
jgi:zinc and cadmium transporter